MRAPVYQNVRWTGRRTVHGDSDEPVDRHVDGCRGQTGSVPLSAATTTTVDINELQSVNVR